MKIHLKKIRNLLLIGVTLTVMPLLVKSKYTNYQINENLVQTQELMNTQFSCKASIFKNQDLQSDLNDNLKVLGAIDTGSSGNQLNTWYNDPSNQQNNQQYRDNIYQYLQYFDVINEFILESIGLESSINQTVYSNLVLSQVSESSELMLNVSGKSSSN